MNKRIAKKFEKRLWIRSCREYREKIEKPYKEYLRCYSVLCNVSVPEWQDRYSEKEY